jgi:hypothetical protein
MICCSISVRHFRSSPTMKLGKDSSIMCGSKNLRIEMQLIHCHPLWILVAGYSRIYS